MVGRILALDYGHKRVGVAMSDALQRIASPMTTLKRSPTLIEELKQIVDEHEVTSVVVGLPMSLDGSEGEAAKAAREFGEQIAELLERPVHYMDERLTTKAADRSMLAANMRRDKRKQKIDAVAASIMLQSFLDARESKQ